MERQFKIGEINLLFLVRRSWSTTPVKPDATPEEVRAVVNDENGGQIFSQAVGDLHLFLQTESHLCTS